MFKNETTRLTSRNIVRCYQAHQDHSVAAPHSVALVNCSKTEITLSNLHLSLLVKGDLGRRNMTSAVSISRTLAGTQHSFKLVCRDS